MNNNIDLPGHNMPGILMLWNIIAPNFRMKAWKGTKKYACLKNKF